MTTTDTDALIERIARALMTHECDQHEDQDECMTCDSSMVTCSHPPFMYCDEHDTAVGVGEPCPVALEHAAAALPIVREEVRKAKAEALREAAGDIVWSAETLPHMTPHDAARGLVRRADRIESGDQR